MKKIIIALAMLVTLGAGSQAHAWNLTWGSLLGGNDLGSLVGQGLGGWGGYSLGQYFADELDANDEWTTALTIGGVVLGSNLGGDLLSQRPGYGQNRPHYRTGTTRTGYRSVTYAPPVSKPTYTSGAHYGSRRHVTHISSRPRRPLPPPRTTVVVIHHHYPRW